MKIVYHKHSTSNSYWDNYSYDEDWYLCDSEEEYQAKLEEYRKKHEEDKNNDNFKKYPCYMPCFYDEGKMHASEYYYAHEWTGKNFDCFGFSYLRKFERGQRHEHFIKPGYIGDITKADNSHCAGWMYGS